MNGDLIVQANFGRMLSFHREQDYYATVGAKTYSHQVPFGCLERHGAQLRGIEEKPLLDKLINAGIYTISPDAWRDVPTAFFPIVELFHGALARGLPCGVFDIEDEWSDLGQPQDYLAANGVLWSQRRRPLGTVYAWSDRTCPTDQFPRRGGRRSRPPTVSRSHARETRTHQPIHRGCQGTP